MQHEEKMVTLAIRLQEVSDSSASSKKRHLLDASSSKRMKTDSNASRNESTPVNESTPLKESNENDTENGTESN